jgi:hypothetical protein
MIDEIILAEGTLTFQYTRSGTSIWLIAPASVALITIIACLAVLRRKSSSGKT